MNRAAAKTTTKAAAPARPNLLFGFSKESLDRAAEFGSMDGIG